MPCLQPVTCNFCLSTFLRFIPDYMIIFPTWNISIFLFLAIKIVNGTIFVLLFRIYCSSNQKKYSNFPLIRFFFFFFFFLREFVLCRDAITRNGQRLLSLGCWTWMLSKRQLWLSWSSILAFSFEFVLVRKIYL